MKKKRRLKKHSPHKNESDLNSEAMLINGITWILLQDIGALLEEAVRLFKQAAKHDKNFKKSSAYHELRKRLNRS